MSGVEDLYSTPPGAPDTSYRMRHTAPTNDGYSVSICDLGPMWGEDAYDHPEWSDPTPTRSDIALLRSLRGKPDAVVTIYRAVPHGVTAINPGDWVTTSRTYAEQHGAESDVDGTDMDLIEARVPAKTLWNQGSGLLEFGYDPYD